MDQLLLAVAIGLAALVGSTIAGVAGFGGAVVLMPIVVWAFGIREAVPILTVVQVIGNLSRTVINRKEAVLPWAGWFIVGAAPMSILGASLFATLPTSLIQRTLGAFLLAIVAFRHTAYGRRVKVGVRSFVLLGALIGFFAGLLGIAGPLAVALFLSTGLTRAALVGTDAVAAMVVHGTKLAVYGSYDLVTPHALAVGGSIGVVMVVGSLLGRRLLDRMSERTFALVIETVMVASGLQFLIFG